MANSIVAIYTHIIFAVKYRNAILDDRWRDNMFKYIHTMIENRGNPCVIVGGYRDHVHILCNLKESVDELVRALKLATGNRIRKNIPGFKWQKGYVALSKDYKSIPTVKKYIEEQIEHHRIHTFAEEYDKFLKENGIEIDERFGFRELE